VSHIALAIDKLIEESRPRITGADLSRASGINMAQISRIRNGLQVWVNPEDLHKICLALCKDPKSTRFAKTHARLLFARLQDELTGPGAKFITLAMQDIPIAAPSDTKPKPALPTSLQENLDLIAEHIEENRNVRDLIGSIANLCRREPLSQPASK